MQNEDTQEERAYGSKRRVYLGPLCSVPRAAASPPERCDPVGIFVPGYRLLGWRKLVSVSQQTLTLTGNLRQISTGNPNPLCIYNQGNCMGRAGNIRFSFFPLNCWCETKIGWGISSAIFASWHVRGLWKKRCNHIRRGLQGSPIKWHIKGMGKLHS